MLEKQISEILAQHLSKFICDINDEQLQVSLWSGQLTLRNVRLQRDVLEEVSLLLLKNRSEELLVELERQRGSLSPEDFASAQTLLLPFTVVSGVARELTITIPWASLDSTPVVVTVSGVEVTLGPLRAKPYDVKEELAREEVIKQTRLAHYERERRTLRQRFQLSNAADPAGGLSGGNGTSSSFSSVSSVNSRAPGSPPATVKSPFSFLSLSFLDRMVQTALQNAQLHVREVSCRYVFDYDTLAPSLASAVSLWIDGIDVQATDENYSPTFQTSTSVAMHRTVAVSQLSLHVHSQRRHGDATPGTPGESVASRNTFMRQWTNNRALLEMGECTIRLKLPSLTDILAGKKQLEPVVVHVSPKSIVLSASFDSLHTLTFLARSLTEGLNGARFRKRLHLLQAGATVSVPNSPFVARTSGGLAGAETTPVDAESSTTPARLRWRFALACALDTVRQARAALEHFGDGAASPMARVMLYGKIRRHYCSLWKRHHGEALWLPPLDRSELVELSQLERALPLDQLVFLRCLSYAEVAREAQLRQLQSSYISSAAQKHSLLSWTKKAHTSRDQTSMQKNEDGLVQDGTGERASSNKAKRGSWWRWLGTAGDDGDDDVDQNRSDDAGENCASKTASTEGGPPPSSSTVFVRAFYQEWRLGRHYGSNPLLASWNSPSTADVNSKFANRHSGAAPLTDIAPSVAGAAPSGSPSSTEADKPSSRGKSTAAGNPPSPTNAPRAAKVPVIVKVSCVAVTVELHPVFAGDTSSTRSPNRSPQARHSFLSHVGQHLVLDLANIEFFLSTAQEKREDRSALSFFVGSVYAGFRGTLCSPLLQSVGEEAPNGTRQDFLVVKRNALKTRLTVAVSPMLIIARPAHELLWWGAECEQFVRVLKDKWLADGTSPFPSISATSFSIGGTRGSTLACADDAAPRSEFDSGQLVAPERAPSNIAVDVTVGNIDVVVPLFADDLTEDDLRVSQRPTSYTASVCSGSLDIGGQRQDDMPVTSAALQGDHHVATTTETRDDDGRVHATDADEGTRTKSATTGDAPPSSRGGLMAQLSAKLSLRRGPMKSSVKEEAKAAAKQGPTHTSNEDALANSISGSFSSVTGRVYLLGKPCLILSVPAIQGGTVRGGEKRYKGTQTGDEFYFRAGDGHEYESLRIFCQPGRAEAVADVLSVPIVELLVNPEEICVEVSGGVDISIEPTVLAFLNDEFCKPPALFSANAHEFSAQLLEEFRCLPVSGSWSVSRNNSARSQEEVEEAHPQHCHGESSGRGLVLRLGDAGSDKFGLRPAFVRQLLTQFLHSHRQHLAPRLNSDSSPEKVIGVTHSSSASLPTVIKQRVVLCCSRFQLTLRDSQQSDVFSLETLAPHSNTCPRRAALGHHFNCFSNTPHAIELSWWSPAADSPSVGGRPEKSATPSNDITASSRRRLDVFVADTSVVNAVGRMLLSVNRVGVSLDPQRECAIDLGFLQLGTFTADELGAILYQGRLCAQSLAPYPLPVAPAWHADVSDATSSSLFPNPASSTATAPLPLLIRVDHFSGSVPLVPSGDFLRVELTTIHANVVPYTRQHVGIALSLTLSKAELLPANSSGYTIGGGGDQGVAGTPSTDPMQVGDARDMEVGAPGLLIAGCGTGLSTQWPPQDRRRPMLVTCNIEINGNEEVGQETARTTCDISCDGGVFVLYGPFLRQLAPTAFVLSNLANFCPSFYLSHGFTGTKESDWFDHEQEGITHRVGQPSGSLISSQAGAAASSSPSATAPPLVTGRVSHVEVLLASHHQRPVIPDELATFFQLSIDSCAIGETLYPSRVADEEGRSLFLTRRLHHSKVSQDAALQTIFLDLRGVHAASLDNGESTLIAARATVGITLNHLEIPQHLSKDVRVPHVSESSTPRRVDVEVNVGNDESTNTAASGNDPEYVLEATLGARRLGVLLESVLFNLIKNCEDQLPATKPADVSTPGRRPPTASPNEQNNRQHLPDMQHEQPALSWSNHYALESIPAVADRDIFTRPPFPPPAMVSIRVRVPPTRVRVVCPCPRPLVDDTAPGRNAAAATVVVAATLDEGCTVFCGQSFHGMGSSVVDVSIGRIGLDVELPAEASSDASNSDTRVPASRLLSIRDTNVGVNRWAVGLSNSANAPNGAPGAAFTASTYTDNIVVKLSLSAINASVNAENLLAWCATKDALLSPHLFQTFVQEQKDELLLLSVSEGASQRSRSGSISSVDNSDADNTAVQDDTQGVEPRDPNGIGRPPPTPPPAPNTYAIAPFLMGVNASPKPVKHVHVQCDVSTCSLLIHHVHELSAPKLSLVVQSVAQKPTTISFLLRDHLSMTSNVPRGVANVSVSSPVCLLRVASEVRNSRANPTSLPPGAVRGEISVPPKMLPASTVFPTQEAPMLLAQPSLTHGEAQPSTTPVATASPVSIHLSIGVVLTALYTEPVFDLIRFFHSHTPQLSYLAKVPESQSQVQQPTKGGATTVVTPSASVTVPNLRLQLQRLSVVVPTQHEHQWVLNPTSLWNEVQLDGICLTHELKVLDSGSVQEQRTEDSDVAGSQPPRYSRRIHLLVPTARLLCRDGERFAAGTTVCETLFPVQLPSIVCDGDLPLAGAAGVDTENTTTGTLPRPLHATWLIHLHQDSLKTHPIRVTAAHLRCIATSAVLLQHLIQHDLLPSVRSPARVASSSSSNSLSKPCEVKLCVEQLFIQLVDDPAFSDVADNEQARRNRPQTPQHPSGVITQLILVHPLLLQITTGSDIFPEEVTGVAQGAQPPLRVVGEVRGDFELTDAKGIPLVFRRRTRGENARSAVANEHLRQDPGGAGGSAGLRFTVQQTAESTRLAADVSDVNITVTSTTIDYVLEMRRFVKRSVVNEVDRLLRFRETVRGHPSTEKLAVVVVDVADESGWSPRHFDAKLLLHSVHLNVSDITVVSIEETAVALDFLERKRQGLPVSFTVEHISLRPFSKSQPPLISIRGLELELGPGRVSASLRSAVVRNYNTLFYIWTFDVVKDLAMYVGSHIDPWKRAEDDFRFEVNFVLRNISVFLYAGVQYREDEQAAALHSTMRRGVVQEDAAATDDARGITGYAEIGFPEVSLKVLDSPSLRRIVVETENGYVSQHNVGLRSSAHDIGHNIVVSLSYEHDVNARAHNVALRLGDTVLSIPNGETLFNFTEAFSQSLFPLVRLNQQNRPPPRLLRFMNPNELHHQRNPVDATGGGGLGDTGEWLHAAPLLTRGSGETTSSKTTDERTASAPILFAGHSIRASLFFPLFSVNICHVDSASVGSQSHRSRSATRNDSTTAPPLLGGNPVLFGVNFHGVSAELTSNASSRVALLQITHVSHAMDSNIQRGLITCAAPVSVSDSVAAAHDPSLAVAVYARYETLFVSAGEAASDGKPVLKTTLTGRLHNASLVFSPSLVRVVVENMVRPIKRSISRVRDLPLSTTEEVECGDTIPAHPEETSTGGVRILRITSSCHLKQDLFLGYNTRLVFCHSQRSSSSYTSAGATTIVNPPSTADSHQELTGATEDTNSDDKASSESNVIIVHGLQNAELYLSMVTHPTGAIEAPIVVEDGITVQLVGVPVVLTEDFTKDLNDYIALGERSLFLAKNVQLSPSRVSHDDAALAVQVSQQPWEEEGRRIKTGTVHNTFSVDLTLQLSVSLTSSVQTMSAGMVLRAVYDQIHRFEAPLTLRGASQIETKRFVDESGEMRLSNVTLCCNGGPLTQMRDPIMVYIQHGKTASRVSAATNDSPQSSSPSLDPDSNSSSSRADKESSAGVTKVQAIVPPASIFISMGHVKMIADFLAASRPSDSVAAYLQSTLTDGSEMSESATPLSPPDATVDDAIDEHRRAMPYDSTSSNSTRPLSGACEVRALSYRSAFVLAKQTYLTKKKAAFCRVPPSWAPVVDVSITAPSLVLFITNALFKPLAKVSLSDTVVQAQLDRQLTSMSCMVATSVCVTDVVSPTTTTTTSSSRNGRARSVLLQTNVEAGATVSRYPLGGTSCTVSVTTPCLELTVPLLDMVKIALYDFEAQNSANFTLRNLTGDYALLFLTPAESTPGSSEIFSAGGRFLCLSSGTATDVDWLASHGGYRTRLLFSPHPITDLGKASQLFLKATPIDLTELDVSRNLYLHNPRMPYSMMDVVVRLHPASNEILLTSTVLLRSRLRNSDTFPDASLHFPGNFVVPPMVAVGDAVDASTYEYVPFTTLSAPFQIQMGDAGWTTASTETLPLMTLETVVTAFLTLPAEGSDAGGDAEHMQWQHQRSHNARTPYAGDRARLANSSTLLIPLALTKLSDHDSALPQGHTAERTEEQRILALRVHRSLTPAGLAAEYPRTQAMLEVAPLLSVANYTGTELLVQVLTTEQGSGASTRFHTSSWLPFEAVFDWYPTNAREVQHAPHLLFTIRVATSTGTGCSNSTVSDSTSPFCELHSTEALDTSRTGRHDLVLRSRRSTSAGVANREHSCTVSVVISDLGEVTVKAMSLLENRLPFSVAVVTGDPVDTLVGAVTGAPDDASFLTQRQRHPLFLDAPASSSSSSHKTNCVRLITSAPQAVPTAPFAPHLLTLAHLLKCEEAECVKLFIACVEDRTTSVVDAAAALLQGHSATHHQHRRGDVTETAEGDGPLTDPNGEWRCHLPLVVLKALWVMENTHTRFPLRVHFVGRSARHDVLIPPQTSVDLTSFGLDYKSSGDPEVQLQYVTGPQEANAGFYPSPPIHLAALCSSNAPLTIKHVWNEKSVDPQQVTRRHCRPQGLVRSRRVPDYYGGAHVDEYFSCLSVSPRLEEEQYHISVGLSVSDNTPLIIENRTVHAAQCNVVLEAGASAITSAEQAPAGYVVDPLQNSHFCWDVVFVENPVLKISLYPPPELSLAESNRRGGNGTDGSTAAAVRRHGLLSIQPTTRASALQGGTVTVDVAKALAAKEAVKIGDFFGFVFFSYELQRYYITLVDNKSLESQLLFQPRFISHVQFFLQELRVYVSSVVVPNSESSASSSVVAVSALAACKKTVSADSEAAEKLRYGGELVPITPFANELTILGTLKQTPIDVVFVLIKCLSCSASVNERRALFSGDIGSLAVMDCTLPDPRYPLILRMSPSTLSSGSGKPPTSHSVTSSASGVLPALSITVDTQWPYNHVVRHQKHRLALSMQTNAEAAAHAVATPAGSGAHASSPQQQQQQQQRRCLTSSIKRNTIVPVESFSLRVCPVQVMVDDTFLSTLRHVVQALEEAASATRARAKTQSGDRNCKIHHSKQRSTLKRHSTTDLYVGKLDISEIAIRITLTRRPDGRFNPFDGLPSLIDTVIPSIDGAPINVKAVRRAGLHFRNESLTAAVASSFCAEYKGQVLLQLYKLVGSLEMLGNPLGLVTGWGRGLKSLVSTTVMERNPWEGARRFLQSSGSSTLHSVGLLSAAGGRTIAAFSVDKDYWQQREHEARHSSFFADVASGVSGGVRGVVTQPLHGAQQRGLPGLVTGLATGVVGLVGRPVAGVLYGVGGVAEFYSKSLAEVLDGSSADLEEHVVSVYRQTNRNFRSLDLPTTTVAIPDLAQRAGSARDNSTTKVASEFAAEQENVTKIIAAKRFLSPDVYTTLSEEVNSKNLTGEAAAAYILQRIGAQNFAMYVEFGSFLRYAPANDFFTYVPVAVNRCVMLQLQAVIEGRSTSRPRSPEELRKDTEAQRRGENIRRTLGIHSVLQYMPLEQTFLVCSLDDVRNIVIPEEFQQKCGPILQPSATRSSDLFFRLAVSQ